jgi:PAS domain S-box-containing protein
LSKQDEHERIGIELASRQKSSDPFVGAVRATRMPVLITDPNQSDNPIVFVNDAFLKLTGYERDEILGRNCRFLQGSETDRSQIAKIREAIAQHAPIEVELQNHKKNGEIFFNRLLISPVFDEDGGLTYFFASQFDVTLEREKMVRLQRDRDALEAEVERRSQDLAYAEESMKFMLKAGRLGTWALDLTDQCLTTSELCRINFGRKPDEPFDYAALKGSIIPEDRDRVQLAVNASIESHADYDIEYRIRTPEGEVRWLQIRGQTFYRADGSPIKMAGVSIDITERKRSEEHRALLAEELNHRVKNLMATIQSIAHQTLRSADTLEDATKNFDSRLRSLASAHDVLTSQNWEGATLADIVASAVGPFRIEAQEHFKFGGPFVKLTPTIALATTMALHEMATNAVKYGALSNDQGHIELNWKFPNQAQERIWMRWQESGGPLVSPPSRTGFGTRMLERVLAAELNGTVKLDYQPQGVVLTIEAPLMHG